MEIAEAPTFTRVSSAFAKKLRMFEVLSGDIEDATTLRSLDAKVRAMEGYHEKGWLPDGWLPELLAVAEDHRQILQEQE